MPPVLIAAGIGAAGMIGGSIISSNATKKAANATTQAADTATAEARREFDIGQANQQPWLTTGTSALSQLAQMYGLDTYTPAAPGSPGAPGGGAPAPQVGGAGFRTQPQAQPPGGAAPGAPQGTVTPGNPGAGPDYSAFYKSPDYAFRLSEGLKGIDAGAAARGMLDSGATRKAEIAYAGNLASGEFTSYANRLATLAGIGQTTATATANQGQNYATNVGKTQMDAADARASSYQSQGDTYGSTIAGLGGIGSGLIQNLGQSSDGGSWMGGGGGLPGVYITPQRYR